MSQSLGHDPLCTWRQAEEADAGDPRRWLAGGLAICDCDKIAKVREDMLAKCIKATIRTSGIYINLSSPLPPLRKWIDEMDIVAALRALQEKP